MKLLIICKEYLHYKIGDILVYEIKIESLNGRTLPEPIYLLDIDKMLYVPSSACVDLID